ncbi:GGDEF domain-containing protein [Thermaerobacter subterraneus]|uniref:Diguanylate cyclase (GGDEF) domain-containing protein n=1 Tax=Thermaerobacter subterraneus DSM 13965 TaxID=867903 RepID=K6Q132_9FIRM|nr:sensor domain-containing diguanylate cyclase [Thermaerobacter subterraneus]EKP94639.1 diguanylate cyclase (GGDEF) domain-containing protein [Thermaerobacter subterraneus DSM 13965]
MRSWRSPQRVYILAVGVGGMVALILALRQWEPVPALPMLMMLAAAVLMDAYPLPMPGGGAMSLTFGVTLTAQLLYGTVPAAIINVLGNLIGYGVLNRRPWDRTLFNAGQFALTILTAGAVSTRLGLHPWPAPTGITVPPLHLVFVYVAIYWVMNNALVGLALYYHQAHPTREFLRLFFRWLPVDALSTAFAVAAHSVVMIAFQAYGEIGMAVGLTLFLMINYLLRLHMRLVEAHHDLQSLYEITKGLACVLELDDAFGWIDRAVQQLAPSDAFAVYLAEEGDVLRLQHAVHPDAGEVQGRVAGEGAVRRAARERQLVEHVDEPTLVTENFEPSSVLAVPLSADERLMGCLCLARRHRAFGDRERRLLSILASPMAMAIQNGLIYGRTQTMAHTDPMTGLYNYRFFSMRLREAVRRASATGQPLALILIDLDNFSDINNQFGHRDGDHVLRQFADLLRHSVRQQDLVARYAGDEFVAILPGARREEAEAVADRIREAALRYRFTDLSGQIFFPLRFSLGVAVYPYDGPSDEDLIAAADRNMYREKRHHRERYRREHA